MEDSLDSKVIFVQQWLAEVSPDLASAKYEINDHTVNYLYQLAKISQKKTAHNTVIAQDNLAKAEQYSVEADRLEQQLDYLGVSSDGLSEVSRGTLADLADTACHLHISDPSNENYMLALSDLTAREMTLSELVEGKVSRVQCIRDKLTSIAQHLDSMREEVREDKENSEPTFDHAVETGVAKSQAQRYQEEKVKYKDLLRESGIRKEYTHRQLEKESTVVSALQQEVTVLKERLAVFKKLPPSLSLAEEQVRQLEVEIASVDLEIHKKNM